ncbi:MAG: HEPN domain-containing protein [Candidatus Hodarchaeota archaeon]
MILDVSREKQKIDHIFNLANQIQPDDELLSHWAKYLCVLTSGFVENSLRAILTQFVAPRSSSEVANYVESKIRTITNLNEERVYQLLWSFSSDWGDKFREKRTEKQKDAIDSVVANRNLIVHGRSVGITIVRMREYYAEIIKTITMIDEECVHKSI